MSTKLFQDGNELMACAGMTTASGIANSREIAAVVLRLRDTAELQRDTDPQVSDIFMGDIRYRMGVVKGINLVLGLQAQAQDLLNRAPKGAVQ